MKSNKPAPSSRVVIGEQSFIDAGQNLQFYEIYVFKSQGNNTLVDRLTVTPGHDACTATTVEAAQGVLPATITQLLSNEDSCSISEKALQKEAIRCKGCAISGGAHITVETACHQSTRLDHYEVLDRDIFEPKPDTPKYTARIYQLLKQADAVLGSNILDRPAFPTGDQTSKPLPPASPELDELANGTFDHLFAEAPNKPSVLYKQTREPKRLPTVTLSQSTPLSPLDAKLPAYPPYAKAAHQDGDVVMRLNVAPDGTAKNVSSLSGPPIFQKDTLETANQWHFPPQPQGTVVSATVSYRMNCSGTPAH